MIVFIIDFDSVVHSIDQNQLTVEKNSSDVLKLKNIEFKMIENRENSKESVCHLC